MHYALIGLVLACGVLGALLRHAYVRTGELDAQLSTVTQERDDAKAQADSLIAASRQHARDLARARKQAAGAAAKVARSGDDGCLDRDHPADIGDVLRMRPENGKADAPAASGRTPDADV